MALVWKKTAPKIWSKVISSKSKKNSSDSKTVCCSEAKADYRRKFLDGLKFYCESPSLILNSDLPADLVEYVTSQGFPIEALGIILEIKKLGASAVSSSQSQAQYKKDSSIPLETLKFNEISRKLVEEWMTSDSCSEAFVSLSIGEEVPGILAETSNFQRILFTIVDYFHLSGQDFLRFLLGQCLIILTTLAYGIKEDSVLKVRSQPISAFLERILLRFHSNSEHFRPELISSTCKQSSNPFVDFFMSLSIICEEDFIVKRLLSKVFLGLGTASVIKVANTLALIGSNEKSTLTTLLQPSEEFLKTNPVWKHALLTGIPFKTHTTSTSFWSNWAKYVFAQEKTTVWTNCVQNWTSLCSSTYMNGELLIPATFALISLGKEVKKENESNQSKTPNEGKVSLISVGDILESVTKCLDSTDETKRSCGMAVAQVIAELHFPQKTEEFTKLEFETQSEVFKKIMSYYNDCNEDQKATQQNDDSSNDKTKEDLNGASYSQLGKPIKVLDSDDEDEPEEQKEEDEYNSQFEPMEQEEEYPLDERLQSLRLTGNKIPKYFSEIVECLVGDGKSRDEAEKEALKEVAVLKIPVLLGYGVRIDANMASLLSKILLDLDGGRILEVPIILSLFEMSYLHPHEVYGTLASVTFDKDHHSVGHRSVVLSRYSEVVQLISKQKCFSCYSSVLDSFHKDLCSLTPDFINTYYESRKQIRRCKTCTQKLGAIEIEETVSVGSASMDEKIVTSDETALNWRQIVDNRIAAKTRYLVTPKKKTIYVPDDYSARLVAIIWSCLANQLDFKKEVFLVPKIGKVISGDSLNDMLLAQIFRVLGRIIVGLAGPHSPHLRSIAMQVGELVTTFISHNDRQVRRSVLSLLAITVTTGEGKPHIIEALSSQNNIIELLKPLSIKETDGENKELFTNVLAYITSSAIVGLGLQLTE